MMKKQSDVQVKPPKKLQLGEVEWSSGICACCDDPGACAIVCCCSCIVAAQLYERQVGPPGQCRRWFFRLGLLCTLNLFVVLIRSALVSISFGWEDCPLCTWDRYWQAGFWPDVTVGASALTLAVGSTAIVVRLLVAVRGRVRAAEKIPPGRCGRHEDCCVACWCTLCLQCQLLRELGLRWGPVCCANAAARRERRYTLRSPTGDRPERVGDEAAEESGAMAPAPDSEPGIDPEAGLAPAPEPEPEPEIRRQLTQIRSQLALDLEAGASDATLERTDDAV